MSSHTLTPHLFSISNQVEVLDFDCGSEPWEVAVADWIKGSGVLGSMARGSVVWLYRLGDGTIIGYGSLGTTTWKWPAGEVPDSELVSIIPSLALRLEFHGQPAGVAKSERFSTQIMDHLLSEDYKESTRYLVLEVHSRNVRAAKLYESYGFTASRKRIQKSFDGVVHDYTRMYLRKS